MTWVTVPSTVCADAPGYVALTRIDGGAMEGYCSIGNPKMLRPPASMITIAITQAKTGLSMKYFDMMKPGPGPGPYWACLGAPLPASATSPDFSASSATAVTCAPGATFWTPSTTTRSPAATPSLTSHLSPIARSALTVFCATFWSGDTAQTKALPSGRRTTACCGTMKTFGTAPQLILARTNRPGSRSLLGFGKVARSRTEPVVSSTLTSEN